MLRSANRQRRPSPSIHWFHMLLKFLDWSYPRAQSLNPSLVSCSKTKSEVVNWIYERISNPQEYPVLRTDGLIWIVLRTCLAFFANSLRLTEPQYSFRLSLRNILCTSTHGRMESLIHSFLASVVDGMRGHSEVVRFRVFSGSSLDEKNKFQRHLPFISILVFLHHI